MVAVLANDEASVPVKVIPPLVRESAVPPVFLTVTVWVALAAPTLVEAKVNAEGDRVAAGDAAAEAHSFTRLVTLTDPRPVARS